MAAKRRPPIQDKDLTGELYVMSMVVTAAQAVAPAVARIRTVPHEGGLVRAALVFPPPDTITATDDRGTLYHTGWHGHGTPGRWAGDLQIRPAPPPHAQWLELSSAGQASLRIALTGARQTASLTAEPRPSAPGKQLRRAVADRAGAADYSYRRPSRRAAVTGDVVLPALRRPVPEVAVVCDTSGSMTDELLAMVLAEVEGPLRSLGASRQLRVLACDAAAGPAQRVSSARQVELAGGGTNMGAGIAAAALLRPRPAITVVLTDGYTPWPGRPPKGMLVVVALLGDASRDAPAWARSVRVPASSAR